MNSLIANSGIQLMTFRLELDAQDKFKMWFHEWYDTEDAQWKLELIHEIPTEDGATLYYKKLELFNEGYLSDANLELDVAELRENNIFPIMVDDEKVEGVKGEMFKMSFSDKNNAFECFVNKWLPAPYFFKRTEKRYSFGPVNWSRFKLIPRAGSSGKKEYDVLLAFDTRTGKEYNDYNESPVFCDNFRTEQQYGFCDNEFFLMDFCSQGFTWSYIDDYIFKLVHPTLSNVSLVRGKNNPVKMSYLASYFFLLDYIATNKLFPTVKLIKNTDVEIKNVNMVVDIGNSKTTALVFEDQNISQFKDYDPRLQLIDYTNTLKRGEEPSIRKTHESFDMRLAFRKVDFGNFGIKNSKQFVYPSFVRLGDEANNLVHLATATDDEHETLSTYSSPKRYLWDDKPSDKEWRFLVLPGEEGSEILQLNGITELLASDGTLDITEEKGGRSSHYSRRSLMTFAFLEMLVQANTQINSDEYREKNGYRNVPRRLKKLIVTCPTAMSKIEREALTRCAKDAVTILNKFKADQLIPDIEVIPAAKTRRDSENVWYYDEATCSQLVYIYGEVGYKYKGICSEFFNLYGKKAEGASQNTLTVGSLDIGAGTSDLMINEFSYVKGDIVTLTPNPKFYDSFYFAGDDMLNALIRNAMLLDEKHSAFRKALKNLDPISYRQKIKNYFGPDHAGQSFAERIARRDFNLQYSVPLMNYFLGLASDGSADCSVTYKEVFESCPPNERVINDFKKRMGIDITCLNWEYDKNFIDNIISREFDPLMKKIAAMFFAHSCDIILLSGRPASLPAIRNIFLKYYPVSPNRLITLNNYYIGDWYPFTENTGFIKTPKTIVAMGGVIGYYSAEYAKLDRFAINLEKLSENLKSTVNYIEASKDGEPINYAITPASSTGEITISKLPFSLKVRQLGLSSYPARDLYSIDFNRIKLASKIKLKAEANGEILSDEAVRARVKDEIDVLQKKMPFTIVLERDAEDKENIVISGITDKFGQDLSGNCIEIHIQSLGVDERGGAEQYWLDSGAFNF